MPTKVHIIKAFVFPVIMHKCENWIIKKAECRRIDAFELRCWRRLLRVPWIARRFNQSVLKEISPEYSLEGLRWSWSSNPLVTWSEELTQQKRYWHWERLRAGGKVDDRGWGGWMASPTRVWCRVGITRHESEQAPGVGDGQGGLACCSPWGRKESDTTEQLNWTEENSYKGVFWDDYLWEKRA